MCLLVIEARTCGRDESDGLISWAVFKRSIGASCSEFLPVAGCAARFIATQHTHCASLHFPVSMTSPAEDHAAVCVKCALYSFLLPLLHDIYYPVPFVIAAPRLIPVVPLQ